MEFRTVIHQNERRGDIKHHHRIMLIGSCFSDNIGNRLCRAMFNAEVNPFGTVYNPASIRSEIERIINAAPITDEEIFLANGMWNHFSFHSQFSRCDKDEAVRLMNLRLSHAHEHLKRCDEVIITLGTAFVYRNNDSGNIVSNCHKLPAVQFTRSMMSVSEVTECLDGIVQAINSYAPQAKVVFTVSPIRHLADGLEQNQLSKSTLRVAIGETVAKQHECCSYFPAYEIMMDDLRDYRFYAADMTHPSDVAVEYIWNAFKEAYLDERTIQTAARCERIYKRLEHRPMTDNKEAIARFRNETAEILKNLMNEFPYLKEIPKLNEYLAL